MLKKAGVVAVAAAGLMLAGSPAFAAPGYGVDQFYPGAGAMLLDDEGGASTDQLGVVNFGNDADLLSDISALCNLDVNVLAIPVLQGNDEGFALCANAEHATALVHEDDD